MIHHTFDAAFLNGVANDPQVRAGLGGEGALDLAAIIADPANIALTAEHGGWVLHRHEPGTYELHTLFLPVGRGRDYFKAAAEALDWVFTRTDAREIVTRVPMDDDHAPAMLAARLVGFAERFRREKAWAGRDAVAYMALDIDGWCARSATALEAGGRFHDELELAKGLAGSNRPTHPDEPAHDRAAGAAVLMARAGQARKAVWFYNRWARLAGYETITLLSEAPVAIDVVDAIVGVRDGTMEVLKCR